MKTIALYFAVAAVLLANDALADITVVWKNERNGKPMTVEYKDAGHLRMTQTEDLYALFLNGRPYIVQKRDGEPVVIDLEETRKQMEATGMAALLENLMKNKRKQIDAATPKKVTMAPTGKIETIAGVKGEVYVVTLENVKGEKKVVEATLTTNQTVRQVWSAWTTVIIKSLKQVSRMIPVQKNALQIEEALRIQEEKGLAPIRIKGEMVMSSISEAAIPDKRFELPAEPVSVFGGGRAPFPIPGQR